MFCMGFLRKLFTKKPSNFSRTNVNLETDRVRFLKPNKKELAKLRKGDRLRDRPFGKTKKRQAQRERDIMEIGAIFGAEPMRKQVMKRKKKQQFVVIGGKAFPKAMAPRRPRSTRTQRDIGFGRTPLAF